MHHLKRKRLVGCGDIEVLLRDPAIPNGADRIRGLFAGAFQAVALGDRRGCLLCTAAAGPSRYADEIAAVVSRGLGLVRDGSEAALRASPRHADLDDSARGDLADMLITQYVGLRTMARARLSEDTLRNVVRGVGVMLD